MLAHRVNLGFQDLRNRRLVAVGSGPSGPASRVTSLRQLAGVVDAEPGNWYRFELAPRGTTLAPEVLVLERAQCRASEAEILAQNRISTARKLT